MSRGNWGRWGPDDEVGAANLIDSGAVRRAAGLVAHGTVVSLAQPLGPNTPVPGHRHPPRRFMERTPADSAHRADDPRAFRYAEDAVLLPTHSGTHVDALSHAWCGHELYNGHPADATPGKGAIHLGAEKLSPVVTRGLLLDLVPDGVPSLEADAAVGPGALERACERAGGEPGAGDAVLLRTGWWERHAKDPDAYFAAEPGLNADGAQWLADRDVAVVGADNCAVEIYPFVTEQKFPVHLLLLHGYGVQLIENLDLGALAAAGATEFMFVAAPLPLVGSVGSPLTPLAIM